MIQLSGISASPGVVVGKALVYDPGSMHPPRRLITPEQTPLEQERFQHALTVAEEQIRSLTDSLEYDEKLRGLEGVFSAHLAILRDPALVKATLRTIEERRVNAEYALTLVMADLGRKFRGIQDELLRARLADFRDIAKRVMRNLMGYQEQTLARLDGPAVIVAHELAPSDTVQIDRRHVLGFATDMGGPTSHTAIIARAFELPAVVGLQEVTQLVNDGDLIALDGDRGIVVISPDQATVAEYASRRQAYESHGLELARLRDLPACTIDGYSVSLMANIEIPQEVEAVQRYGAEGIGLYRTEFLYLSRETEPDEEDHYAAYKAVAEAVAPQPVIIRTLDLGGDKFASQQDIPLEMNPFLGWRAIRMCLERRDLFRVQLRAILRASVVGNIRMMYPMISSVREVVEANQVLEETKRELRAEGIAFDDAMPVGAMIEIPSAALTADAIARHVNFFSIGTNDLIQYTLAVDRVNPKIGHLYDPLHPAVLRLIKETIDAGHRHHIDVAMCGEMASDPALTMLMVGLGLDELSMSPAAIPEVKNVIRSISIDEAVELARQALSMYRSEDIRALLPKVRGVPEPRLRI